MRLHAFHAIYERGFMAYGPAPKNNPDVIAHRQ